MDQTYGEVYRELYLKYWWWRSRAEFIVRTLRALPPSETQRDILDIGCGDGLFFERLAEFGNVEGVEPSAELVSDGNPIAPVSMSVPSTRVFNRENAIP